MMLQKIIEENKAFLNGKPQIYFSPGRVNLIGEHIDYLGGNVFPTAIDLGTYAMVTKREDQEFHFLSHNFRQFGSKVVHLDDLDYSKDRNWANFGSGMIQALNSKGMKISHGLNILVYGTLPNSSGLSSSASLEVLIGYLLSEIFEFKISMLELVQLAQQVENNYIGVNCGIMDQFAVGMSKENYAIYLNTNTLEYDLVPLVLDDYTLVIANTNKKRALADSKYNERRSECDLGLKLLQENQVAIENLCDLSVDEYQQVSHNLPIGTIKNRVEHAVYESDRTKSAVKALQEGNLKEFGRLMNLSHDSLRDLYEVSCLELDTLVNSFRENGAIGSRMTGAGFGGCTISLVKSDIIEEVVAQVSKDYIETIGYPADFYICKTSDGTKRLFEEEV